MGGRTKAVGASTNVECGHGQLQLSRSPGIPQLSFQGTNFSYDGRIGCIFHGQYSCFTG
uniref:Uncharacterized protein n=1 Tax=Nelumbo nucifera TaxID=4432 RepID=A0A822Y9K4_NELNU|nr:TPA_asm: hypothetical protein HUJ06_027736 [Nelumbo nucifera]